MKKLELTGKVFGNWTVIKRVENWSNKTKTCVFSVWLCKCICGKEQKVYGTSLTQGRSISCGCSKQETKYKEGSAFGELYRMYKSNAKRREIEFHLSDREFLEIITSPCFYTGRMPYRIYQDPRRENDSFVYNGIDRIDSTKGYTKENCVPCCFEVNRAKSDLTHEEFLKFVEEIYNKHCKNT